MKSFCIWFADCPLQSKILATQKPEFKKKLCLVIFLFNQPKNNAVLELRTGHFRGFEAKGKDWASRPRSRLRTSKCVLEDVLKAKDILEDSISACHTHRVEVKYLNLYKIKNIDYVTYHRIRRWYDVIKTRWIFLSRIHWKRINFQRSL